MPAKRNSCRADSMASKEDRIDSAIQRRDSTALRKIAQKTWKEEERNLLSFLADVFERDQQNEEGAA